MNTKFIALAIMGAFTVAQIAPMDLSANINTEKKGEIKDKMDSKRSELKGPEMKKQAEVKPPEMKKPAEPVQPMKK